MSVTLKVNWGIHFLIADIAVANVMPMHSKLRETPLPSGTLSPTLDLDIFATASRLRCQQHSSSLSTVQLFDDTYTTVDESWPFTTSRSTATL